MSDFQQAQHTGTGNITILLSNFELTICFSFRCGTAWKCFDKHAGYWLGLDTPKYQRYILERERMLRMEEREAMHGEEAMKQSEKV